MRILVIQNDAADPPGRLGQWLSEQGCELDVCEAWHRPVPADLREYAGLLVLGGWMDADDDERCGWLPATRALIATAAATGVPALGVCLGLQLGALALGGAVERNPHGLAFGLRQVDWEPDVLFDPLVSTVAGEDRAVHFNQDVVTRLPAGAIRLASTLDGEVQAARLAPTVWGVQFHPEADRGLVAEWIASAPGTVEAAGGDPVEVLDAIGAAEQQLMATWRRLAVAFATIVRGRAAAQELR